MIAMSKERAFNILSKMVSNITWRPIELKFALKFLGNPKLWVLSDLRLRTSAIIGRIDTN